MHAHVLAAAHQMQSRSSVPARVYVAEKLVCCCNHMLKPFAHTKSHRHRQAYVIQRRTTVKIELDRQSQRSQHEALHEACAC